jgi:hypothetical protein
MDPSVTTYNTNLPGHSGSWFDADTFQITYTLLGASTMYWVDLSSQGHMDLAGNALGGDMYKEFTTADPPEPVSNLAVTRNDGGMGSIDLAWDAEPTATDYNVYRAENRFSGPWTQIATVPAPGTTHADGGGYSTAMNYFYLVKSWNSSRYLESGNSTMGAKAHMSFTHNAVNSNINWVSLPYNGTYAKASDIVEDIGVDKISAVGKWDAATQTVTCYFQMWGKWYGPNFDIMPGDAVMLNILQDFDWIVTGIDHERELNFVANPPADGNVNLISLPYTSNYMTASDIVLDIEGSLGTTPQYIMEVGKWDASTQTYITYTYVSGSGWTGTDFTIEAGEAVYLNILQSFNWTPTLVTAPVY